MYCTTCNSTNDTDVVTVNISDLEKLELLEKYHYEHSGLLNIIAQFGSDTVFKPDMDRYRMLISEYIEAYTKYSMLYNMIYNDAISQCGLNKGIVYNSNIDFQNACININK